MQSGSRKPDEKRKPGEEKLTSSIAIGAVLTILAVAVLYLCTHVYIENAFSRAFSSVVGKLNDLSN